MQVRQASLQLIEVEEARGGGICGPEAHARARGRARARAKAKAKG
jgi:hypothetical protein